LSINILQDPRTIDKVNRVHCIAAEPIIARVIAIVLSSPKKEIKTNKYTSPKMANKHDIAGKHKENKKSPKFSSVLQHANNLILILELFKIEQDRREKLDII
jgi:hypothetical protein